MGGAAAACQSCQWPRPFTLRQCRQPALSLRRCRRAGGPFSLQLPVEDGGRGKWALRLQSAGYRRHPGSGSPAGGSAASIGAPDLPLCLHFPQILYTYPENWRAFKALIAAQYSGSRLRLHSGPPNFTFGQTNRSAGFLHKFPLGKVSMEGELLYLLSSFFQLSGY